MKAIKQVAGAVVGAGTVLNPRMLSDALDAGAEFIVSPGLTDSLGEAAVTAGIPFLPGIANASNIMTGLDIGLDSFKFFPASTSGGVAALKALSGPFRGLNFFPTGGISAATSPDWPAPAAVRCVRGREVVPHGPLAPPTQSPRP